MSDEHGPEGEPAAAPTQPMGEIEAVWEEVIADMEATAEEYREEGWTVVEVHPGDVTALAGTEGNRWGLDVLAPDDEFEAVEELVDAGHEFDRSEVFRATVEDVVFLVIATLDEASEHAIVFPAYYDFADAGEMVERAESAGELVTHIRPLDQRTVVSFSHGDVDRFVPKGE